MEKSEPCPSCRTETPLRKSWVLRRGKGSKKIAYRIFLYKCPTCGRSFRKSKPESTEKGGEISETERKKIVE